MENKYYTDINPLEKEKDILDFFSGHNPKSFSKNDAGYDWLEEDDSKCIVFENPYGGNPLEIAIGDDGRFTLFFSEHHAHYEAYQGDYYDMVAKISDIFSNTVCAAVIKDHKGDWYGSRFLSEEDSDKGPTEVFDFVFREPEFFDYLTGYGYSYTLNYWNPVSDKTVTIKPEASSQAK
ncbi:MAG: hypothetical protein K6G90_14775 [Clostridia bacterium]|nr:hypothetical protein [Clostridia bacterium]